MPTPINGGSAGAPRPMFRTLSIASSGLFAQRMRMETIATNIANAETTHTEGGGPYRRRVVNMTADGSVTQSPSAASVQANSTVATTRADAMSALASDSKTSDTEPTGGVKVTGITEDASEGPLVYEPGHPDANADGYVRYPNVRVTDEIVDLMDAKRIYEANATVFQAAKSMLRKAIEI